MAAFHFSLLRFTADVTNTHTRNACSGAEKKHEFSFRRETFLGMHVEIHSVRLLALLCPALLAWLRDRFMHACTTVHMHVGDFHDRLPFLHLLPIIIYKLACLPAYLACPFARLSRLSDGTSSCTAYLHCMHERTPRFASFRADVCFAYGR